MSLIFMPDDRLYTDYAHFCARFTWPIGSREPAPAQPLLYHAIWSGRLTRHHELSLKSLLLTQSAPYEVWLWLTPETEAANGPFLERLRSPAVRYRRFDLGPLAVGTPFEGREDLLRRSYPVFTSDIGRLLIQWKYGGIYFDLDVLFLRDLRPLTNVEFVYRWSNQPYGNSAVMHYRPQSPTIAALIRRGCALGTCYAPRLYQFDAINPLVTDLYVLPAFVFDPAWIAHDTQVPINAYSTNVTDFFLRQDPVTLETFYPSAYAYHWHNGWKRPITDGSIAGQLYREVCDRLAQATARQPVRS